MIELDYTTTLLITIRTAESPGELSFLQGGGCYMIPRLSCNNILYKS